MSSVVEGVGDGNAWLLVEVNGNCIPMFLCTLITDCDLNTTITATIMIEGDCNLRFGKFHGYYFHPFKKNCKIVFKK